MKTFKIPFKPGNQGNFEMTGNFDENLRQSIKVLLSTEPKSRIMELDYGGSLRKFLFEPNDDTLKFIVKNHIVDKFKKFLPEIKVNQVDVERDDNVLYIKIVFVLNEQEEVVSLRIQ